MLKEEGYIKRKIAEGGIQREGKKGFLFVLKPETMPKKNNGGSLILPLHRSLQGGTYQCTIHSHQELLSLRHRTLLILTQANPDSSVARTHL